MYHNLWPMYFGSIAVTTDAKSRRVNVVEISGEVLRLKHISRGQDENATLQTDIIVNGHVPVLAETSNVIVLPYVEDFVQLADGTYTAPSQRLVGFRRMKMLLRDVISASDSFSTMALYKSIYLLTYLLTYLTRNSLVSDA